MLLQRFVDYSQRIDLPPTMYEEVPIKWLLDIDRDGNFRGFIKTAGAEVKDDRGKRFPAPHALVTSGPVPKLLLGSADYVLGIVRKKPEQAKEKDKERAKERHDAFVALVKDCFNSTKNEEVEAVLKFLESFNLKKLKFPEDFKPEDVVAFTVDGDFPFASASVKEFWVSNQREKLTKGMEPRPCMVCGELKRPVYTHPVKIKGVPGPQTSGTSIVSANEDAFLSYGLAQSLIAPTCLECSDKYAKAANALIGNQRNRIFIGPLLYLFWSQDDSGLEVGSLLTDPQPEEVKELIRSAYTAREEALELDTTPFYATALASSGGRVAVRDWLETTVGTVRGNLARFFRLQRLVDWDGSEGRPHRMFSLAASLFRDARKEMTPNVPKVLLHFALTGGPLPSWILFHAIKRVRAEQSMRPNRAALIKMVLQSNLLETKEEDKMEKLDTTNDKPAYLCGRLLAVLERIQKLAVPGIKATLIDKFFGTASSAPASVFGTLMRGSQAHLVKLRKTKPGTSSALQKSLEEVTSGLRGFPSILSLEEQGLFALGYYHQRAADRAAAKLYAEGKEKEEIVEGE